MISEPIEIRNEQGEVTEVIVFAEPEPEPQWYSTDIDGDKLLITTARYPDGRHGLYFRTSPQGSVVTLADLPDLMEKLIEISTLQRERESGAG